MIATFSEKGHGETIRLWIKHVSDTEECYTLRDSLLNEKDVVVLDRKTGTLRYSFDEIPGEG